VTKHANVKVSGQTIKTSLFDQTRLSNGKMFSHQTIFDGVWSPNVFAYFPKVRERMLMAIGDVILVGCISNAFRLKLVYVIIINPFLSVRCYFLYNIIHRNTALNFFRVI